MELNDAAHMLGSAQPVRSAAQAFRDLVLGHHEPNTNRHGLATSALAGIEHGIAELARLGHHVHVTLAEPSAAPVVEFPKMLVWAEAPFEMMVHSSQEEADARAAGWSMAGDPAPIAQVSALFQD